MVQYPLTCLQRPNKKNSTTNAPASSEADRPPTPTPSTPITPVRPNTFAGNGKGALATAAGGATNLNADSYLNQDGASKWKWLTDSL
jgi:hypothetical protein